MEENENPTRIKIEQGEDAIELIAHDIERIADAAESLLSGPLDQRTIVLLLQDRISGAITRGQINAVLEALPALRDHLR